MDIGQQSETGLLGNLQRMPAYLSIAGSVLYLFGFIVVNGFLGTYGVFDLKLFSARYFLAGALASGYALFFYFFVGRKIDGYFKPLEHLAGDPRRNLLAPIYFIYGFVELVFAVVTFTVFLAGATFADQTHFGPLLVACLTAFLCDRYLIRRGAYKAYPVTCRLATGLLFIVAIAVFFLVNGELDNVGGLNLFFVLFFAATFTVVLEVPALFVSGKHHDPTFGRAYFAYVVVGALIAFGSTVYEYTNPQWGGGAPTRVSLVLSDTAPESLRRAVGRGPQTPFLLGETDDYLLLRFAGDASKKGDLVRVSKSQVLAVTASRKVPDVPAGDRLRDLFRFGLNVETLPRSEPAAKRPAKA